MLQAFGLGFTYGFIGLFVYIFYGNFIFKRFLSDTAGNIEKMIYRGGVHVCLNWFVLEVSWRFDKYLVHRTKVIDDDVGFILFAPCAALMVSFGRIMQGTAQNLTSAILLEISGTVSEVMLADALLRGRPPYESKKKLVIWLWNIVSLKRFRTKAAALVVPESQHMWLKKTRPSGLNTMQKIKRTQVDFCASAMMILTITEGASVLAIASFMFMGSPLSFDSITSYPERIPRWVVATNYAIMLVGEVFITDGIVTLMSRCDRYIVDLPLAWQSRNKRAFRFIYLILALFPLMAYIPIPNSMCLTSKSDVNEHDWILANCPLTPREICGVACQAEDKLAGIQYMSRVAPVFLAAWQNATAHP